MESYMQGLTFSVVMFNMNYRYERICRDNLISEDISMEIKRLLHRFTQCFILGVVVITSSTALGSQAGSQSEQPIKYELKLEGENIEQLVLQSGDQKQTFDRPGKSLMLKPGTYEMSQLQLKGGFIYYPHGDTKILRSILVGHGESAILKAGGPLEQRITAQRKGQLLKMDYRLIGIAGEWYRNDNRYPPTFTIYIGDKEIASGKFQFG